MMGSRYRPIFSTTVMRRLTCVSDTSRWNGVGWTEPIGSATSMTILTSETSIRLAPNQVVVARDSLLTISGGMLLR
jgi:hypothetical protein